MYDLLSENTESTVVSEYQPILRAETTYQTEAELERVFIEQLQAQAYEYLPIKSENDLIANLRRQLELLNNYRFSDTEWEQFFNGKIANRNYGIEDKTTIIQEDYIQLLQCDDGTMKNIYLIDKDNIHNNRLQVINQYSSTSPLVPTPETDAALGRGNSVSSTGSDTVKKTGSGGENNAVSEPAEDTEEKTSSPSTNSGGENNAVSEPAEDTAQRKNSVAELSRSHRYDVTILVNGLPLVHVELKKRGVDLKEAFNQIDRYSRESFWAGTGLFEYVQLFVISNGTHTKYYSNTTRFTHIKEATSGAPAKGKRSSNSFEFTSWWADAANQPIPDLMDFTSTFFAKHTLLNLLTKYCVFTTDKLLLVMRPYQIVATERILGKINVANNYKIFSSPQAGGYVWHTTGSGKTLTSFKTALLASKLPYIDKVLFVVDRKDLDYQTMKEYDRFEKGSANSNTSTAVLKEQLEEPEARIIITTIQKLSILIKKHKNLPAFNQHCVIIFDECHRSQFGNMHAAITKSFKKYHLFGFTGTPILAKNLAGNAIRPDLMTTDQVFGERLHTYTVVDAIRDKNVLPFRVDYVSTMREQENITDTKVWDIDREGILLAPERIDNIVKYILEHFDQKTKRNTYYQLRERRLAGFNSILATASIDAAKRYYAEFKKQMAVLPSDKQLKVALIYSFGANEDEPEVEGLIDEENPEDTSKLDQSSRDFLETAIQDYNRLFKTNYDTSSDKFQNYYKDVSKKLKDREIDLLIVVNMFLTGFDATTLNTLWVDKNLRLHGLMQAFSRTNRILNSVKTFGNIVCFRNLEEATNESISLFGDKDAAGVVLLKTYDEYYYGYKDKNKDFPGYAALVNELQEKFPPGKPVVGEQNQKDFIRLYGNILKVKNILSAFDAFAGNEILSQRDMQDYQSMYIDLYNEYRKKKEGEAENVNDDIVFEMELVKQVEINIDYILELIRKYHKSNMKDKEIVVSISKAVDSSMELRNKKDLIEQFIDSITPSTQVDEDWQAFVEEKKKEELDRIIDEEHLNRDETYRFLDNAFRDGFIQTTGTAIGKVLPPVSRFTPTGDRTKKRETVLEKLTAYFKKFWDISGGKLFR